MLRQFIAASIALVGPTMPVRATEICAWLVESERPGNLRNLDLWFQADTPFDFRYDVAGRGIVMSSGDANEPDSSAYSLSPGKAENVWSFNTIFFPPGKIDIAIDIHRMPLAGASHAATPLIAKFAFKREVPAGETNPPPTLAEKRCMEVVDEN
jgi:hypothetical protein